MYSMKQQHVLLRKASRVSIHTVLYIQWEHSYMKSVLSSKSDVTMVTLSDVG